MKKCMPTSFAIYEFKFTVWNTTNFFVMSIYWVCGQEYVCYHFLALKKENVLLHLATSFNLRSLQWIRNKNLQFIYKFDVNLCRGDWTTFNEWRDCRLVSDETGSMYIILFVNMTSHIYSKKYVYDMNMYYTQNDI